MFSFFTKCCFNSLLVTRYSLLNFLSNLYETDLVLSGHTNQFIAAGFKYEGKQQIQKAAQNYFQQFVNTQVEIQRIIIDGDQGAVEWDWCDQERQTGQTNYAQDVIILELKEGKIIYWREYIEKKNKQT